MITISREQIRVFLKRRMNNSILESAERYDQGYQDAIDGIVQQAVDDDYLRGYDEGSVADEELTWKESEYEDMYTGIGLESIDPVVESMIDLGIAVIDEDEYPLSTHSSSGRMMDYGSNKSDSHEGRMTKAKLFRMGRMAQSLEDRIEDGDDLPEWVQDKITTAEDRLSSAYRYIDYKLHRIKNSDEVVCESKLKNIIKNAILL